MDHQNCIYEILLTFVDITQIEMEAASRLRAQTEGETLLHFVRVPPQLAGLFINSVTDTLEGLRGIDRIGHDSKALARRLHTLKGNARSLGLAALAHMIHEMKDALPVSDGQAQRLGNALQELLERLLEFHHEVLVRPELKSTLADFVRQTVQDAAQKGCFAAGEGRATA